MSKYKNQNLITITDSKGKVHELWGLVKSRRSKLVAEKFDQDYVDDLRNNLKSTNTSQSNAAREALLFLNASVMAELDGNFTYLEALGVTVTDEMKRKMYNDKNAAERDFTAHNQFAQVELTDDIQSSKTSTIGEMVDTMKSVKKKLRREGKSVADFYEESKHKPIKPQGADPLPMKRISSEEYLALKELENRKK